MIRRWLIYLIALIGCLALFMANQGWFAWLLLLCVLWLPVLSLVVSLPAILSIHVQVGNGGTVPAGTQVMLRAKVRCPLPVPEYRCKVRVTRKTTGESVLMKLDTLLPTQHCGNLDCTPDRCWVFDYLCLFRFPIRKVQGSVLTVHPLPVELPLLQELDALQARSWRPKPGGGFAENHEMRLFRPGDSLNQVHWKLTAKTGKLTVREAMEPARGRILLTMELRGSHEELDRKLGSFYWLSDSLLQKGMRHELRALTANGVINEKITSEQTLLETLERLLESPVASESASLPHPEWVAWHYHIGGGTDEV